MGLRTRSEIEAMALAETATGRAIVTYFLDNANQPADYFQLMHLGSNGTIAAALNRLMDDGMIELHPLPSKNKMALKLRDYDPA